MSYVAPNTGDSVHDLFIRMVDFHKMKNHLLEADTLQGFIVWFSKCEQCDKRSLYLFLQQQKENIPEEYLDYAQSRFIEEI